MKLHEKILTHFLSCTSPVDKEGYLYKKKERSSTFQRRWFVLKANLLFYQERPADRHLLGVIVLEGCEVGHSVADGPSAFSLSFGSGLKTYRFEAEDVQQQQNWVKALTSAGHQYLCQLLAQLETHYKEVKASPGWGDAFKVSTASLALNSERPPEVRPTRSLSAPSSTKGLPKKSPKLRWRRNAHVTPLNGPAAAPGEWPSVGLEFLSLHQHYGLEVKKTREDWLRGRPQKDDLIHLD